MQFKSYLPDFFQNSLRKKHLIALIFSMLIFPAIVFAADDIQQTDFQSIKEMLKQAEKLSRKGEFAEAEKVLRRAVALYPQDKNAKLDLAYVLLKEKHFTVRLLIWPMELPNPIRKILMLSLF